MLPQDQATGVISWIAVASLLVAIGLWLYSKGILRTRQFIYVFLPVSLTLANLVAVMWFAALRTWGARLLVSTAGMLLVMLPVHMTLRLKGVDVDKLDRKRRE